MIKVEIEKETTWNYEVYYWVKFGELKKCFVNKEDAEKLFDKITHEGIKSKFETIKSKEI